MNVTVVGAVSLSVSEAHSDQDNTLLMQGTLSQLLSQDDFELFGLTRQFEVSRQVLDERWKQLQRQAHPDKFAAQGAAAQRVAMQCSVRINEAYQRLRDPIKRAAYMCQLAGVDIAAHTNTAMPAEFLMQQMQWRESLEEAHSSADLETLADEVMQLRGRILTQLQNLLDIDHDWTAAAGQVRALMFIEKFSPDVQNRLDEIDHS
jgi:molecular chaperone HscB